jgi:hypothetical protein
VLSVNRRTPVDRFFAHLDTEYKEWVIKHQKDGYVLECRKGPKLLRALYRRRLVIASTVCDFAWRVAEISEAPKKYR